MNSPGDIECFQEQREYLGQKGPELGRLSTRPEALRPVTEVQDLVKERRERKEKDKINEGRERKRETKSETEGGRLRKRKGSKEGRKGEGKGKVEQCYQKNVVLE